MKKRPPIIERFRGRFRERLVKSAEQADPAGVPFIADHIVEVIEMAVFGYSCGSNDVEFNGKYLA